MRKENGLFPSAPLSQHYIGVSCEIRLDVDLDAVAAVELGRI